MLLAMFYLYLFIIFLLGALSPVQTSANSKAKEYLNSPIVSSLCSFIVGTAALVLIVLITEHSLAIPAEKVAGLPWWAWAGGAAGAIGITANILLFPKLGAMQTVLMPMLGQIITGFFVDSFGLFNSPVYPISAMRILGFIIVLIGIFYVVSHKGKHFRRKDTLVWQFFGIGAGAILAMQPAMNSGLSIAIDSSSHAALISFTTGTFLLAIFAVAVKEHREHIHLMFTVKRPLWTWIGGLIGVCMVIVQAALVKEIGVGLLTILNIFGMLVCSVFIDHYGLLGAERRPVTMKKFCGLVLVLAGIILLNV